MPLAQKRREDRPHVLLSILGAFRSHLHVQESIPLPAQIPEASGHVTFQSSLRLWFSKAEIKSGFWATAAAASTDLCSVIASHHLCQPGLLCNLRHIPFRLYHQTEQRQHRPRHPQPP